MVCFCGLALVSALLIRSAVLDCVFALVFGLAAACFICFVCSLVCCYRLCCLIAWFVVWFVLVCVVCLWGLFSVFTCVFFDIVFCLCLFSCA